MSNSVQFRSTPLNDLLIFSGLDIEYASRNNTLDKSYQDYKKNLKFSNDEYLKLVEKNLPEINTTNFESNVKEMVSKKVTQLIKESEVKKNEEKQKLTTWWEKLGYAILELFEVIGQLFQGHGFRTKIEWEVELRTRINNVDKQIFRNQLEDILYHSTLAFIGEKREEILEKLISKLNSLRADEFTKVINEIFLKQYEDTSWIKSKFVIYYSLNDSKKALFNQALVNHEDWFRLAYDIVESSIPEESLKNLHLIISSVFIEKAKADLNLLKVLHDDFAHTEEKKQFFTSVFVAIVQDYYDKNDSECLKKLTELFPDMNSMLSKTKFFIKDQTNQI